jgi:DNA-3-methyladenine glycosylase II
LSGERDGLRPGFDWEVAKAQLAAADPRLRMAAARVGWPEAPPSWRKPPSLFDGLVRAVIAQQLSARAAGAVERRVEEALGCPLTPAAVLKGGETGLRALGLSAAKAQSLIGLADAALRGSLPLGAEAAVLSDAALLERLCRHRGVGRWTAEMVLIFTLGRPDVLAVADLGLRRGYAHLLGRGRPVSAGELASAGEAWRPHRTLASLLLWRLAAHGPLDQHQCQGS